MLCARTFPTRHDTLEARSLEGERVGGDEDARPDIGMTAISRPASGRGLEDASGVGRVTLAGDHRLIDVAFTAATVQGMTHLLAADGSVLCDHDGPHDFAATTPHAEHEHGEHRHSHGLVDRSLLRSRAGIRAVSSSLGILALAALSQTLVYAGTPSVALLADLIHNFGDALTAVPLGLAFFLRSAKAERLAGLAVVLAIFASALVALGETVERFLHARSLSHLWLLAAAGLIGFLGNELAARVRLRAGRRLQSPALVADGQHARLDGFVSLGVLGSACAVATGLRLADPIIGLVITIVILRITWESWRTVTGQHG